MKNFIANWKMNGSIRALETYCQSLADNKAHLTEGVILALPALYIPMAHHYLKNTPVAIAAQCVSAHNDGAYTGQLSARMFAELGCSYAIIGHSERRNIESIASTHNQMLQCIHSGLKPILCIGETLQEKNEMKTIKVLTDQLQPMLALEQQGHDIWVAYEPRWAIGSGLTPDNNEINIVAEWFKNLSATKFIYGGSVNPNNMENLAKCTLDGFLVGGASLDYDLTNQMVNICTHYS
ncbi:MAG: triose-phosphate isomerase [Gammaproteobacteria bacterium]|nr:triose-phosphate isomerase [Gammaproteobacteria bacterium]